MSALAVVHLEDPLQRPVVHLEMEVGVARLLLVQGIRLRREVVAGVVGLPGAPDVLVGQGVVEEVAGGSEW